MCQRSFERRCRISPLFQDHMIPHVFSSVPFLNAIVACGKFVISVLGVLSFRWLRANLITTHVQSRNACSSWQGRDMVERLFYLPNKYCSLENIGTWQSWQYRHLWCASMNMYSPIDVLHETPHNSLEHIYIYTYRWCAVAYLALSILQGLLILGQFEQIVCSAHDRRFIAFLRLKTFGQIRIIV